MSDLLTLLEDRGLHPIRVSDAFGGEYASACPGPVCKGEGRDRFHVWPRRANRGGKCLGRYWCRQCGIAGDTIQYLIDVDGMSYSAACASLGLSGGSARTSWTRRKKTPAWPRGEAPWMPHSYPDPPALWQEQAEALVTDCQERLERDKVAQAWLAARGISMPMARLYRIGYNASSKGGDRYRPLTRWGLPAQSKNGRPGSLWLPQGWLIPSCNDAGQVVQLRIRRRDQDLKGFAPGTKYLLVKGSSMATMLLHPAALVWVVVESGFDAVLLAGFFGERVGVATTWNSSARPDARAHKILSASSLILGALDYDHAGDAQQGWWQAHYAQYRRLPALPGKAKDPGDAFRAGADLYEWLVSALPRPLQRAMGVGAPREAPLQENAERPGEAGGGLTPPGEATAGIPYTLPSGRSILLARDPAEWEALLSTRQAVFLQNELACLRPLLAGMDTPARDQAVDLLAELKEIFPGARISGIKTQTGVRA